MFPEHKVRSKPRAQFCMTPKANKQIKIREKYENTQRLVGGRGKGSKTG